MTEERGLEQLHPSNIFTHGATLKHTEPYRCLRPVPLNKALDRGGSPPEFGYVTVCTEQKGIGQRGVSLQKQIWNVF